MCVPDKGVSWPDPIAGMHSRKKNSSEGRRGCLEEHPPRSQWQKREMVLSNTEFTVLECFFFHYDFGDKAACECSSRGSWANAKPGALIPLSGLLR